MSQNTDTLNRGYGYADPTEILGSELGAALCSARSLAPRWDGNGEPITLSAAAMDALEWLEWMRDYLCADKSIRLDQARANLARCAIALRSALNDTITGEEGPPRNASEQSGVSAEQPIRQDGLSSPNVGDQPRAGSAATPEKPNLK